VVVMAVAVLMLVLTLALAVLATYAVRHQTRSPAVPRSPAPDPPSARAWVDLVTGA
jgi:hypothetical protein